MSTTSNDNSIPRERTKRHKHTVHGDISTPSRRSIKKKATVRELAQADRKQATKGR